MLTVVAGSVVLGHGWLKARAADLASENVRVEFDTGLAEQLSIGEWLRRDFVEIVQSEVGASPLDHPRLAEAQRRLSESGWFRGPVTLKRMPAGLIRIEGVLKTPRAVVRMSDRDRLVSDRGELLGVSYDVGASKMQVIQGTRFAPPVVGEPWLGGDVQAGLALLDFLARLPEPMRQQVAGVDVSAFTERKHLEVITDRGTRVVWGGPVGRFNPGQPSDDVKLSRMVSIGRYHGRIDAGRARVDLRTEDNADVIGNGPSRGTR